MDIRLAYICLAAFFIIIPIMLILENSVKKKKIRAAGYEVFIKFTHLYQKDGQLYIIPDYKLKKATFIEVTGLNEIRKNARLCALEVQYRANGRMHLLKISGIEQYVLNALDRFGAV